AGSAGELPEPALPRRGSRRGSGPAGGGRRGRPVRRCGRRSPWRRLDRGRVGRRPAVQPVPDAANGDDLERNLARELLPQPADVDVDGLAVARELMAPYVL